MDSRYDNFDETEKKLMQVWVSMPLKDWFQTWCKLNDVNGGMSGAVIMVIKGIKVSEQYDPQPTPAIERISWAIKRAMPYMKGADDNGNGNKKHFRLWA